MSIALASAIALTLARPDTVRAALTVTAHPQTVRPGRVVMVHASTRTRCRMLVERSASGIVTQRTWFSGGTAQVHVLPSAAVGQRLVDVTCGRLHAHTHFRVDDGYTPSHEQGNSGPAIDSSGTLGGSNFINARLADLALSAVGRRVGPCRRAVIVWAREASGGSVRLGGSYFWDLGSNGGVRVERDAASKGDIIQLYNPLDPGAYRYGMHTAVVVAHASGSEVFDVVDSNFDGRQRVEHHFWNPYATARQYHLSVSIWRLGTVDGRHRQPSTSNGNVTGDIAARLFRVHTGCDHSGCGLIVRAWPSNRFHQIGVLYNDQLASVFCQTTGESLRSRAGVVSDVWDGLSTGGYVPDLYVGTSRAGTFSSYIPLCGSPEASPPPPPPAPPASTNAETSGGVLNTWSSYIDAGGAAGPSIAAYTTIQVACKVAGFRVADGNTWWYRIASSPWSGAFYASADGFYNNGERNGSLAGTPFVDLAVPDC